MYKAVSPEQEDCQLLLRRVAGREEQAFETIFDQYGKFVQALASNLVNDPHDVEEIVQDVFLELWRRPPNASEGPPSLLAWLSEVTRSRCWRMLRRKRLHISFDESSDEDLAYLDPSFTLVFDTRLRAQVELVFSQVAGAQRAILDLTWFHGFGATQISKDLGLPLIAVRRHVAELARLLRRRLTA